MLSLENQSREKTFLSIIAAVSILIPLVVALLMFLPRPVSGNTDFPNLPLFHAILNGSTAFFLSLGLLFIRLKKINLHRISMLTAFGLSSVFLISYVIYHFNVPTSHYGGPSNIRLIYFIILASHIILAVAIVPLALLTLYRSFSADFPKHKKIARYTLPLWLYVAVTGVVVYLMMSPYYPH